MSYKNVKYALKLGNYEHRAWHYTDGSRDYQFLGKFEKDGISFHDIFKRRLNTLRKEKGSANIMIIGPGEGKGIQDYVHVIDRINHHKFRKLDYNIDTLGITNQLELSIAKNVTDYSEGKAIQDMDLTQFDSRYDFVISTNGPFLHTDSTNQLGDLYARCSLMLDVGGRLWSDFDFSGRGNAVKHHFNNSKYMPKDREFEFNNIVFAGYANLGEVIRRS